MNADQSVRRELEAAVGLEEPEGPPATAMSRREFLLAHVFGTAGWLWQRPSWGPSRRASPSLPASGLEEGRQRHWEIGEIGEVSVNLQGDDAGVLTIRAGQHEQAYQISHGANARYEALVRMLLDYLGGNSGKQAVTDEDRQRFRDSVPLLETQLAQGNPRLRDMIAEVVGPPPAAPTPKHASFIHGFSATVALDRRSLEILLPADGSLQPVTVPIVRVRVKDVGAFTSPCLGDPEAGVARVDGVVAAVLSRRTPGTPDEAVKAELRQALAPTEDATARRDDVVGGFRVSTCRWFHRDWSHAVALTAVRVPGKRPLVFWHPLDQGTTRWQRHRAVVTIARQDPLQSMAQLNHAVTNAPTWRAAGLEEPVSAEAIAAAQARLVAWAQRDPAQLPPSVESPRILSPEEIQDHLGRGEPDTPAFVRGAALAIIVPSENLTIHAYNGGGGIEDRILATHIGDGAIGHAPVRWIAHTIWDLIGTYGSPLTPGLMIQRDGSFGQPRVERRFIYGGIEHTYPRLRIPDGNLTRYPCEVLAAIALHPTWFDGQDPTKLTVVAVPFAVELDGERREYVTFFV